MKFVLFYIYWQKQVQPDVAYANDYKIIVILDAGPTGPYVPP